MNNPVYTTVRERVTWVRWDPAARRHRISHPWVWTVREDGQDVKCCDSSAEAREWIEAQG